MGVIVFFSSLSFYHGLDMFLARRDALVINGSYPVFFTSSLEKYMQPSNWDHFPNSLGGKCNIFELPLPPPSFRRFFQHPRCEGNGTAQSTKLWLFSFNSMEISFKENIACHSDNRSVANLFFRSKSKQITGVYGWKWPLLMIGEYALKWGVFSPKAFEILRL